ncbi:hypothetical protein [Jannaschia seohaensis]|uniref:Uncharacterized protein n=1 Tax=Jannaschia seohaensis TaxID=475081 RepID=A0A2Y9C7K7_9RHOB|nr:hypothetical protein [Jannaschia seohaensis]PWJ19271.1 hypothetical protein BCF38_104205 [Jannaschia seohaensis]SSA45933.1 hypothetical protein SAMN05421539_104205 [Jannaschia seohaensis]
MRLAFILALPFFGAACVPMTDGAVTRADLEGPPRVASVDASPNRVVIRVSDGARCTAERPEGVLAGWSGVTEEECGYVLPFTVEFHQGGVASRFIIEDPTGVPVGPDGGPGPRAEVFVTDIDGVRRLFFSPLGPNVRFEKRPAASS